MTSGPPGHDDRQLRGPSRHGFLDREVRGPGLVIDEDAESGLMAANLSGPATKARGSQEELIEKTPERLGVGELLGRG